MILVAWPVHDGSPNPITGIMVDGEIIDLSRPAPRYLGAKTAYMVDGVRWADIEPLLRDGPAIAYQSRSSWGLTVPCEDGRRFRLMQADAWGIESADPLVVRAGIERLAAAVEEEGWKPARSPVTIAGRLVDPEIRQLPCRWRSMAHDAGHPGPALVAQSGADHVVEVDLRAAYLHALYAPVPTRWIAVAPERSYWTTIHRYDGIARCDLTIPDDLDEIGPVPVKLERGGLTLWPRGKVSTTLSLAALRWAVDRGVRVDRLHEAALCQTAPLHARAADRIAAIKDKDLRKLVYTRYYGRLSALGGWEGTTQQTDGSRRLPGSRLYWRWTGIKPTDTSIRPDYRPDHASFILDHARHALLEGAERCARGSIVAMHVDCVWTTDSMTAGILAQSDRWAIKGAGPGRWYGTGLASFAGRLLAQGYQSRRFGTLTPASLLRWVAKGAAWKDDVTRRWSPAPPRVCDHATSETPIMEDQGWAPEEGQPIASPHWTARGWVHREREGDRRYREIDRDRKKDPNPGEASASMGSGDST